MYKIKPRSSTSKTWTIPTDAGSIVRAFQGQVPDYTKRKRLDLVLDNLGLHSAFYSDPQTLVIGTNAYSKQTKLRLHLVCALYPDDLQVRPFSASSKHIEFIQSIDGTSLQQIDTIHLMEEFMAHVSEMSALQYEDVNPIVADRACFLAAGVPSFVYQDYLEGHTLSHEAYDMIEAGYRLQDRIRKPDPDFQFNLRVRSVFKVLKRLCPPHDTATINSVTACQRSRNVYQYLTGRVEYGTKTQI